LSPFQYSPHPSPPIHEYDDNGDGGQGDGGMDPADFMEHENELAEDVAAQPAVLVLCAEEEEDFEAESDVEEYARWLFQRMAPAPWTLLHLRRIDQRRWVIEGHRDRDGDPTPGTFFHITSLADDGGLSSVCETCPPLQNTTCIHRRILALCWAHFQAEVPMSPIDNPECVEIVGTSHGFCSWLSVRQGADNARDEAKRLVVRWSGLDRWHCDGTKCKKGMQPSTSCIHRSRSRTYLKDVMWEGEDHAEGGDAGGAMDELLEMDEPRYLKEHLHDPIHARAYSETKPRSHLRVASPAFCKLPDDKVQRFPPCPVASLPLVLPIGSNARCYCGSAGAGGRKVRVRACRIYDIDGVTRREIEVRYCGCRTKGDRHTVGPDLREFNLFNWNNDIIITHRLLNGYTSQAHHSQTPLTAFHTSTSDSYLENNSPHPFFAKSTFNKIHYAFTDIQELEVKFECPICGPEPSTVIWDGVSISYASQHRKSTLQPPTVPTGIECRCVQPRADLCFLPNKDLRKALSAAATLVLDCREQKNELVEAAQEIGLLATESSRRRNSEATAAAALLQFLAASPPSTSLYQLYSSLLRQLAAHETILYLLNPGTAELLRAVATVGFAEPTSQELSALAKDCPAFGNLFRRYRDLGVPPPAQLKELAMAASICSNHVFQKLNTHTHGFEVSEDIVEEDWKGTGVVYGKPKIRERPAYCRFQDGGGTGAAGTGWGRAPTTEQREAEKLEKDAEKSCQKFYSRYSEARQTGGIMGGWCSHGFSLGFHNIPRAEGRNDVFSAIFTRWKTAPRTVIYDFACALGIYCWNREPKYWRNTRFLIDQFHQSDHTKCSKACFLSTYMANDEDLYAVNSSAAECGNAGLARIRKTVSYSNQVHAIKYTRNFLCVWNRLRWRAWKKAGGA
ncbi:hypothetical protein P7C70_g7922, partial [Phenoliferia sp. Uapishka_3]